LAERIWVFRASPIASQASKKIKRIAVLRDAKFSTRQREAKDVALNGSVPATT
jgi:hypothetical protein